MFGLYLHVPFCQRKCPYCDFFSLEAAPGRLSAYIDLLHRQLETTASDRWGGPVTTVYFGGGTPSLLSAAPLGDLLEAIDQRFGLADDAEISLEANPGTVDPGKLVGYRAAGINRLSLGLQSLDDGQLQCLGRGHDRQGGLEAVAQARAAGFDNLSLDLMFALPQQTGAGLASELEDYLSLAPEHLSCYGLTAEPGTPFAEQLAQGTLALPDADRYAEAFLQIHERLETAGYHHYEIANYCRPGRECRHNLGYWERRACLGLGAGAHSFHADGRGSRWAVPADLSAYQDALSLGRDPAVCLEEFTTAQALAERLYLGLRLAAGVAEQELYSEFGCELSQAFPEAVKRLAPWLSRQGGRWRLTPQGWLIYDRLIQEFLSTESCE